jgi:hypothetical protein
MRHGKKLSTNAKAQNVFRAVTISKVPLGTSEQGRKTEPRIKMKYFA